MRSSNTTSILQDLSKKKDKIKILLQKPKREVKKNEVKFSFNHLRHRISSVVLFMLAFRDFIAFLGGTFVYNLHNSSKEQ